MGYVVGKGYGGPRRAALTVMPLGLETVVLTTRYGRHGEHEAAEWTVQRHYFDSTR